MEHSLNFDQVLSILNQSPAFIYIFDLEAGRFTYTNQTMIELLGYDPSKSTLSRKELFEQMIHPEDLERLRQDYEEINKIRSLKKAPQEYRIKNHKSEWLWIREESIVFKADSQCPSRVLGFGTVIDEYKRTQLKLEGALEDLSLSQGQMTTSAKMAALGEMSAGIAHEINNPLTVIQARAFQLQQLSEINKLDKDKVNQISESISKTADKIARIIKSLRSFARDGSNDPMDLLSARSVVEETLEFCRSRFNGQGIDIIIDGLPEEIEVECRIVQLEQVLLNLLNNAFDAILKLEKKWVRIDGVETDAWVEISVTDSGTGIPAEIAEKIMMPFFTTKEVNKGTGLGLSISQGIIRSHGGELFYDPSSSHTRFVIRLPKNQAFQSQIPKPN